MIMADERVDIFKRSSCTIIGGVQHKQEHGAEKNEIIFVTCLSIRLFLGFFSFEVLVASLFGVLLNGRLHAVLLLPQTPCHLIPQAGNDSKPSLGYFARSTEWEVEGVLCLIVFSPTSSPDITRYCNGSFEEMVRKKSILTCRLMVLLWADVDRGCSQKLMYLKCCRYEQEFRNDRGDENRTIFDGR